MLSKREFLAEEKDCASMLGMSLEEYRKYTKDAKVPTEKQKSHKEYDNTILSKLGLSTNDLKTRKVL